MNAKPRRDPGDADENNAELESSHERAFELVCMTKEFHTEKFPLLPTWPLDEESDVDRQKEERADSMTNDGPSPDHANTDNAEIKCIMQFFEGLHSSGEDQVLSTSEGLP